MSNVWAHDGSMWTVEIGPHLGAMIPIAWRDDHGEPEMWIINGCVMCVDEACVPVEVVRKLLELAA